MLDDRSGAAGGADALPSLFSPLDLRLPVELLIDLVREERARLAAIPRPASPTERELLAWRKQQLVDFLAWLHLQGDRAGVSLYVTETDLELSDAEMDALGDAARGDPESPEGDALA